jgi:hypothetical protein
MKTRWKLLITWASVAMYAGLSYALVMYVINPNFLHLGLTSWLLISFLALVLIISGMELAKLLKKLWATGEKPNA